ncbi:uncharacterized protein [Parasteatoda tepidariorum]|uniref:uncharacterized protein isoform X2 n=1 Tax=Parasteatoda tepidariorum TaxID=114398 RepID=UPI0039BC4B37
MDIFKSCVLPELGKNFTLVFDEKSSNDDQVVIRSSMEEEDIEKFVEAYSDITHTCWNVYYHRTNLSRWMYSKSWKCQHSSFRKKPNSKKNMDCKAAITVLTKKISKDTVKKDKFLSAEVPLPTVLTILLKHSHHTNVADSLRFMRVSEEVKQNFFEYFNDGFTATNAKRFHEDCLLRTEVKVEDLANSAINPTQRCITHLYNTWHDINLGSVSLPFEKIDEKSKEYEEKGATVVHDFNGTWAVLVVTAIMKRVHNLNWASEIIFVDSTASCERSGATLTILLTATKIGALPIATIVHENQSTDS